jgi:hypothetical protein
MSPKVFDVKGLVSDWPYWEVVKPAGGGAWWEILRSQMVYLWRGFWDPIPYSFLLFPGS